MGGSHGRSFGTGKPGTLGKAVALAACRPQPVEAVLIGGEVAAWADELIAAGADRVHVVESPLLSDFVEENYTEVWAGLCANSILRSCLSGATPCGRGLSARLAAVLHTGLTADVRSWKWIRTATVAPNTPGFRRKSDGYDCQPLL